MTGIGTTRIGHRTKATFETGHCSFLSKTAVPKNPIQPVLQRKKSSYAIPLVSAAGIFQSNLGEDAAQEFVASPNQIMFERDLGAGVLDEFAHYASIEQASLEACFSVIGSSAAAE